MSDDPCAPIHDVLYRLRLDYERACKPWLDKLAAYYAIQPLPPIKMSMDDAIRAGIITDQPDGGNNANG
jgi:hypothetical protein